MADEGATDNDRDIFGRLINAADGSAVTGDFRISDVGVDTETTQSPFEPAVAYNSVKDEFLVVWWADDLVDQEFEIFGQRISSSGAELGTNDFRISDMGGNGNNGLVGFKPDVAHNPDDNEYLVVWSGDDSTDGEFEIWGQLLEYDLGGLLVEDGGDFQISDVGPGGNTDFSASGAAVAYDPTNEQYLVVWHGDDSVPGDNQWEIFGQFLSAVGGAVGSDDFRISDMGPESGGSEADFDAVEPALAYNPQTDEFLVVWHGDDDSGSLGDQEIEIWGQRIDAATRVETGTNDFRISDVGTDGETTRSGANPTVAFNSPSGEYMVVWAADEGVDNAWEIYGQRLNGAGGEVGDNDFRLSDMGSVDTDASFVGLAPRVAANGGNSESIVVWHGDDDTGDLVDGEFEIYGQRFEGPTPTPTTVPPTPTATVVGPTPTSTPGGAPAPPQGWLPVLYNSSGVVAGG